MTGNFRWLGVAVVALGMAGQSARAQYGYWMNGGAGATVGGSEAQGMAMYAMGAGQYNLDTAAARSINVNTAMQWNQYMYASAMENERRYHERKASEIAEYRGNAQKVRDRLRNNPTNEDITQGDALNVVLNELIDPKMFSKARDYGSKVRVGSDTIRNIPFKYAAAGISISIHQLLQDGPPACLKKPEFEAERSSLRAIGQKIREQNEKEEATDPELLKKAREQIAALKSKSDSLYKPGSKDRTDADRYIKSLLGLASMLEYPSMKVMLAGVEKHPDATLGQLIEFMAAYNLKFGVATTPEQRALYMDLFPKMARLRDQVRPNGSGSPMSPPPAPDFDAPGAVFNGVSINPPAPPQPR